MYVHGTVTKPGDICSISLIEESTLSDARVNPESQLNEAV